MWHESPDLTQGGPPATPRPFTPAPRVHRECHPPIFTEMAKAFMLLPAVSSEPSVALPAIVHEADLTRHAGLGLFPYSFIRLFVISPLPRFP